MKMKVISLLGLRFDNNTLAEELTAAGFSPENETKVLVHGYASNSEKFGTRFVEGQYSLHWVL